MVIIGSVAIKYHFPDFPREPKDFDVIGKNILIENDVVCADDLRVERLENPVLLERYKSSSSPYISKNDLYTLKISHLFWDIKWEKHMFDTVFLKSKGCKVDKNLFIQLYRHWINKHGEPQRSNLNMKPKDFFNNAIKDNHNHDNLHLIINPNPLYKKIIISEDSVKTDYNLWEKLTYKDKLELIREECYVMAFERLARRDYRTAYVWQLKQLILKHLPLWQALFAIENYNDLRKPIINYKEKIENGL